MSTLIVKHYSMVITIGLIKDIKLNEKNHFFVKFSHILKIILFEFEQDMS